MQKKSVQKQLLKPSHLDLIAHYGKLDLGAGYSFYCDDA